MGDTTNNNTQSIADYLAQLLKDKKQLAAFPNVFLHVERLLDDEIGKVRGNLFQINGKKNEPLVLPDAAGAPVSLSEKVYVPLKDHPDFNFVGRILGPRGMTTKQLEQETGCKIMVRGKGSMRDKKKEEQNRGKPNWEHLNDELHVLITVEDTENRANMKMQRAIDEVKKLLIVSEGEDELKKRQLMELAIINGTYRDSQSKTASPGLENTQRMIAANNHAAFQNMVNQQNALRNAPLGGAPLILSPRLQVPTSLAGNTAGLLNGNGGGPPPLIAPGDTQGLLYAQYAAAAASEYANYTGLMSPLLAAEYSTDPSGGLFAR
jgi:protein quaking